MNKTTFIGRIDQSDWKKHLNSHALLITDLKGFLEPLDFPLFADKFIAMIRFRGLEIAGVKSSLEEITINFDSSDTFIVKMKFKTLDKTIVEEQIFTVSEILNCSISYSPLITTERLEIGLLLPSDEPEIIDFLKDDAVWKMRGERYRPLVNFHSTYENNNPQSAWYKYYFAVRMIDSKKTLVLLAFINF